MNDINDIENVFSLEACGRSWRLKKADMEALWQDMVAQNEASATLFEDDERLPYWAELWPSSLGLAAWLRGKADLIHGRTCLDMGCGLGFTALVGQWLGGQVTAFDYEEQALNFARTNARLNNIEGVIWRNMDWRKPDVPRQSQDLIWAGDIMYERGFAAPVADFIAHCLAPHGRVWLAEPGRDVFIHLRRELQARKLSPIKATTLDVWPLNPQKVPVPVNIWEMRWEIGKSF